MKKLIITLLALLLLFGMAQAETWWMEEDKPLAVQSNIACDSIVVEIYDLGAA